MAYAVDGIMDILKDGETGFLVEPGNTDQAVDKLLWLKNNKEKTIQMGLKGKQSITSSFDIDNMVHEQEVLYSILYENVPLKEYYEHTWSTQKET